MISIFLIKTALLRFGIIVKDISFDVDNECIKVNYMKAGQAETKSIPFSQIEELFKADSEDQADSTVPYYAPPGLDPGDKY